MSLKHLFLAWEVVLQAQGKEMEAPGLHPGPFPAALIGVSPEGASLNPWEPGSVLIRQHCLGLQCALGSQLGPLQELPDGRAGEGVSPWGSLPGSSSCSLLL